MPGERTPTNLVTPRAAPERLVLRSRPFRSVTRERDERGDEVVVKRFHHPSPWLALFDGARARREFDALTALDRAGLPVPRPRALRRTRAGWEVHLAPLSGTCSLADLLEGMAPVPGGWPGLAARLGRLLAALQATGWEHGDLHPGNVLVDASGAPWLVDFQDAGRRAKPSAERRLEQVVLSAAEAREALAPRLRARFLLAWWRALAPELRPGGRAAGERPPPELARHVEQAARLRRRELVERGLGRWLRESSRVRAAEFDGRRAWVRRDLEISGETEIEDATRFLVLRGKESELRRRWIAAARLAEHRVPAARPAVLLLGGRWGRPQALAAFERPAQSRAAASREELAELLRERGLALDGDAAAPAGRAGGPGAFYFEPPRALRALDLGS